jgi:hypothetical protein
VVITSRRTLTGLITRHGAHHLPLDTLSATEANALLALRLGTGRVANERAAVAELVAVCGGLPLALGIVAGRAQARPRVPLAEFGEMLRGLGHTYELARAVDDLGHPYAALGRDDRARAAWQEALEMYRAQHREADTDRVQRQLATLART